MQLDMEMLSETHKNCRKSSWYWGSSGTGIGISRVGRGLETVVVSEFKEDSIVAMEILVTIESLGSIVVVWLWLQWRL
jgi:hypothetical protein